MANEFKHKDPGGELTQAEFIAACGDGHIFACQATGDIVYASSATVLSKLARGAANTVLSMGGSCVPAWTASPSVTDLTISGGCITLTGAATDIDLIDNNACALSFDASGQAGILAIDTQNCAEGVKMSGKLPVTGAISTTGALTVGACDTGLDVKFFGASAGAYVLYDQSEDQLEIRGASADATTSTGKLLLSTSLTNVNANDVIGSINFQAPAEAGGTDAVAIAAGIRAVAQDTFTCAVNSTDLIFYTGHSEAATEKFRFTSQGEIGVGGANYGNCGQVLTSGGAGAAPSWATVSAGVTNVAGSCSAVVINECSGDVDFRVESNNNANALVIDGGTHSGIGNIGLGGAVSDGAQIIVNHPATTIPSNSNYYKMYIAHSGAMTVSGSTTSAIVASLRVNEPNITATGTVTTAASVYIPSAPTEGTSNYSLLVDDGVSRFDGQIQAANGSAASPSLSFKCDPNTGAFTAGNDCFQIASNGVSDLIVANSNVHINDCANSKMDAGLSIQQLTADNEIFALKSGGDVAHGMTGLTETDTMLAFAKGHACEGQIVLHAYSEGVVAMHTRGYATCPQTTDTTSSKGVLTFQAYKKSGTSNAALATNENVVSFAGGSVNANFLIKGNGDLHGSDTSISSLDTHCDVGLIRAIETTKRTEGIIKSKWDDHVHENIDSLIDAGLYSVPPWEGGLLNLSQLWRLHNGAIWQLWTTIKDQGDEILGLRQQLTALEGK